MLKQTNSTARLLASIPQPSIQQEEPHSEVQEAHIYKMNALTADGRVQRIDLTFLRQLPLLADHLATGFNFAHAQKSARTIRQAAGDLEQHFVRFARTTGGLEWTINHLNRNVFADYVTWLNSPHVSYSGTSYLPKTKVSALSAIRAVLQGLFRSGEKSAERALACVPDRPWSNSARKGTPVERLAKAQLTAIVRAAESEIMEIRERFDSTQSLIARGRDGLHSPLPDYYDISVALAASEAAYEHGLPSLLDLGNIDTRLRAAICKRHTLRRISSHFVAAPRDLLPFVLILLVATAFNPETVLMLNWSDIESADRLGLPTIRIRGAKGRAKHDPVVVLDASVTHHFSMGVFFSTLRTITRRARALASPVDSDRLFVFAQQHGRKAPKAFRHNGGAAADAALRWARLNFIADHSIETFRLNQIRTTVLDEAHLYTGDLMVVKKLAGHQSLGTGWNHYTSDGMKKRYRERLGEAIVLRERWCKSEGRIDPRNGVLTSIMDRAAATPGFLCLDPYNSPRPGQRAGRLCSAYGECPACPLAAANISDPASVSLYIALARGIYASQGNVTPLAWLHRWGPILTELNSLLSLVTPETSREAEKYSINLPAVG